MCGLERPEEPGLGGGGRSQEESVIQPERCVRPQVGAGTPGRWLEDVGGKALCKTGSQGTRHVVRN